MDFPSLPEKFIGYVSIFWNKLDLLSVLLYGIALVLRYLPSSDCFCAARILLAIDLSIWYLRTLDIFSAVKQLGPTLVMIGQMVGHWPSGYSWQRFLGLIQVRDLKFFMLMLTVFILAFGVPVYSLIYGVEEFSWHLPRIILNLAYWQIFGELEILDEIESKRASKCIRADHQFASRELRSQWLCHLHHAHRVHDARQCSSH